MGRAAVVKGKRISSYGLKVLRRLRSGVKTMQFDDGSLSVGGLAVPVSLVKILESQELLYVLHDGVVEISVPGLSYLRRQENDPKRRVCNGAQEQLDGFRRQHGIYRLQKQAGSVKQKDKYINLAESPLGWLAKRKGSNGRPFITADHLEASERLRRDFEAGGLRRSVTMTYDGIPVEKSKRQRYRGTNVLDHQIDARKRLQQALTAVGPGLADSLLRTCCYLEGLEEVENIMGWPRRSAKIVLRIALDRLGAHYTQVDG